LLAADSWSRALDVPVLTCPSDERVRHLFEASGFSDCLFIPVREFLGRLEQVFVGSLGGGRLGTLRVFPGGPQSSVREAEGQWAVTPPGRDAPGPSNSPSGIDPGCSQVRTSELTPGEGALASRLFSIDEPRRQLRLRLGESHDRIIELRRTVARLESE